MLSNDSDKKWMQHALTLAKRAEYEGEVPVGAVVIRGDTLLGEGWNQPITTHDPCAHAELIAIREAAQTVQNYRLVGTTLYVSLEPCPMCAGAIIHARIERVVFATPDPRTGAGGSVFNLLQNNQLNHQVLITSGILESKASKQLKDFFKSKRKP